MGIPLLNSAANVPVLARGDAAGRIVPAGNLWGYSDAWGEQVKILSATAGDNVLATAPVPAGQVQVCTHVEACDNAHVMGRTFIFLSTGAVWMILTVVPAPPANTPLLWDGQVYLKEGWMIGCYYSACTAGDGLYLNVLGYKMLLDL